MSELLWYQLLGWAALGVAILSGLLALVKFMPQTWGGQPKAWMIWIVLIASLIAYAETRNTVVKLETDVFVEENAALIKQDKEAALAKIKLEYDETEDAKPHYWELLKRIDPERYEKEQAELARKREEQRKMRERERKQADIEAAQRFCRDTYAGDALIRCLNESFLGLNHVKRQSEKRTDYP